MSSNSPISTECFHIDRADPRGRRGGAGSREKGLLIGEGVDKQTLEHIRRLTESDWAVVRAGGPLTMYFGPHTILLALDVQFHQGLSASEVTSAVDRLEKISWRSTRRFKGSLSKRNRLLQARTFRLHFQRGTVTMKAARFEGCTQPSNLTRHRPCYWQIQMF